MRRPGYLKNLGSEADILSVGQLVSVPKITTDMNIVGSSGMGPTQCSPAFATPEDVKACGPPPQNCEPRSQSWRDECCPNIKKWVSGNYNTLTKDAICDETRLKAEAARQRALDERSPKELSPITGTLPIISLQTDFNYCKGCGSRQTGPCITKGHPAGKGYPEIPAQPGEWTLEPRPPGAGRCYCDKSYCKPFSVELDSERRSPPKAFYKQFILPGAVLLGLVAGWLVFSRK